MYSMIQPTVVLLSLDSSLEPPSASQKNTTNADEDPINNRQFTAKLKHIHKQESLAKRELRVPKIISIIILLNIFANKLYCTYSTLLYCTV